MSGRSPPRRTSTTGRGAERPRIATVLAPEGVGPHPCQAEDVEGRDQLAVLLLGQRLEAAGGVDCRADHRRCGRVDMADVAQHQGAHVEPHADAQRPADLARDLGIEAVESDVDVARRAQRLAAAGHGAVVRAEHRHQAVAEVLVDPAAAPGDGLAGLGEQSVQDEHHVVGQARLGDGGEIARVEEQHGKAAFRALGVASGNPRRGGACRGSDEARHGDGLARADLAGEAHVPRRVDAGKRHGLGGRRRRQLGKAAVHADPAGRAARPPAAHRGERHGPHAAHLQQSRSGRDADRRPAAIGHRDPGGSGAAYDAHHRHQQGKAGENEKRLPQAVVQGDESLRGGRVRRARDSLQLVPRPGLGDLCCHLPARHGEARQRRHRQRHGEREQDLPHQRVPRRQAQPVMDADAAVHPHAQQERAVLQRQPRPDVGELPGVGIVGAGEARCTTVVDHMRDQKQRDRQPGGDLRRLPERQLPGEPLGDPAERQQQVDQKRGEEDDRAGPRARHGLAPALDGVHRLQADEAQRVVGEMRGGEEEQDEAGGEPQPLLEIAARQDVHEGRLACCCPAGIIGKAKVRGNACAHRRVDAATGPPPLDRRRWRVTAGLHRRTARRAASGRRRAPTVRRSAAPARRAPRPTGGCRRRCRRARGRW